ncbi:MAG: DUF4292 domain-containing protein [Deltaproteobacteria bacterium]|nr:DUF4292 domain-containing protein [Deltaproteobacteria bacterium]
MRKTIRAAVLVIMLALLAGCSLRTVPVKEARAVPPARDIIDIINAQHDRGSILKAMAVITIDSSRGRYTRTIALALRQPSFLRMETIGFFGPPDLYFTSDGTVFQAFLPGESRFFSGFTTRENLLRFFDIPLSVRDMVSLLSGTIPLETVTEHRFSQEAENGSWRIDITGNGKPVMSIWIEPERLRTMRIDSSGSEEPGDVPYRVSYENYDEATGYPKRMVLSLEDEAGTTVFLRYETLKKVTPEDTSFFELTLPPGITPEFLN